MINTVTAPITNAVNKTSLQPNIHIIEDTKNIAPPIILTQPPASSSFLDNLPFPTITIYMHRANRIKPTTNPAISLYNNFHTTIVIAV